MSFAFNFSGDDIDHGDGPEEILSDDPAPIGDAAPSSTVPVIEHDLDEWLSLLPSQISYDTTTLTSPLGETLILPRRALFDIRAQLMAEEADATLHALAGSDLLSNVYEGGFKTWECSLDLAALLLDRGRRRALDDLVRVAHVVELGAGSALPSLTLLRHALMEPIPVHFTLADFNADVLRLVTLPNVLLAYAWASEGLDASGAEGELEITPELIAGFKTTLHAAGIGISLVSGPWGPGLAKALPQSAPGMTTLVLAAETIYSPASLEAFTALLAEVLKGGPMNKAMVAAKRFYFGVGGSADAFKIACREQGLLAAEVENSGLTGMEVGVGRTIIEVQTL